MSANLIVVKPDVFKYGLTGMHGSRSAQQTVYVQISSISKRREPDFGKAKDRDFSSQAVDV